MYAHLKRPSTIYLYMYIDRSLILSTLFVTLHLSVISLAL